MLYCAHITASVENSVGFLGVDFAAQFYFESPQRPQLASILVGWYNVLNGVEPQPRRSWCEQEGGASERFRARRSNIVLVMVNRLTTVLTGVYDHSVF